MGVSIFKRNTAGKDITDIEEVFNIWELLMTRYENMETINLLRNFIHDRDLSIIVDQMRDDYTDQIKKLEKEAKIFQIKMPQKPRKDIKTSMRLKEMEDQYIFGQVMKDVKHDLFVLNRAVRTSTTNDLLRRKFRDILVTQLKNYNIFVKYGKLKEYMDPAPSYKTAQNVVKEPITTVEAFHLWDHLVLRYDQMELTRIFLSFTHDAEFTAMLNSGAKTLQKQATELENLMLQNEIPLPKRPPESVSAPIDPETLEDVFMFRTLLRGIQEAADLHIRAYVQSIRNDPLRKKFLDFLYEELDLQSNFLKYGKAKGWTILPPAYGEPT